MNCSEDCNSLLKSFVFSECILNVKVQHAVAFESLYPFDILSKALTRHLLGRVQICDMKHRAVASHCKHSELSAVPQEWCHAEEGRNM